MPTSLATLPEDVLLSILELGNIDAADALSLRWTCKSFFHLSERAPYWTIVGKTVRRHDPLPLPPFRTLEQLSPSETRETLVRHLKTKRNLESEEPRFKRYRVISFPNPSSRLSHFGFLPGGRWVVTIQDNGCISVFDFSVTPDGLDPETTEPSLSLPEDAGRIVGSYSVGFPVFVFDFRMEDDGDGRHLIVAVSSHWSFQYGSPTVVVVRFDLDDAHKKPVPPRQLCRAMLPADYTYPFALSGNLLVVLGQWSAFNTVQPPRLIAIDWSGQRSVHIDIPCLQNDPPTIDGLDFTIQDDNILLYRYKQDNQLEVYTYFNISSQMQPLSTMTETPDRIPPDSWATVDLALPPVLPSDPWAFLHICNTPSVSTLRHVPIMARASHSLQNDSGPDESKITSLVWLDLRGMLARLREGRFQRGENVPTLDQFIKGRGYYSDSKLQIGRGWSESDVGTCGRHVLWIRRGITAHEEEGAQEYGNAVQPPTVPTVEMIKLPFVGDPEDFDEETTSKSLRTLQVPLGVNQRMALVRFCDEWGILGYMNNSPRAMQSIHIFDY